MNVRPNESAPPQGSGITSTPDEKPYVLANATIEPIPVFDARGASLVTLAVLATLFALQLAANFVIPVVVAVLLAYALDPAVSFLERRRVPRWLGAFLIVGALIAAGVMSVYALRFQAQAIVDQLPTVVRKVSRAADVFDSGPGLGFDKLRKAAEALQKATDQATGTAGKGATVVVVQQPNMQVKDLFLSGGRGALSIFGEMVMIIFLAYFILLSGDKFKRKFVKVAGRTLSEKKITVQMFDQINLSIQRFMAMLLVANVVLATLTWATFRVIGLDNAGTWGIAAGVLHIVPYFGPVVIAVATSVAALMQFGSIGMAMLVGGLSLLIATLVGVVLTTWMAGRIAKMNTVSVFIGLLLFGWMWGVWGVLLSVPIVVIVKVVSDHVESLKALSEFLGD
ncbi:MAG: AI-2E family transporter [Burkholderiaceae bacterium]